MYPLLLAAFGQIAEPEDAQRISIPVPVAERDIVVIGSLLPVARREAPAAVTTIEAARIEALGEPLMLDLLRLVPNVSVASSGPAGSQTQLRIRGSEANHTLLLIDGIRFNDPAAGNEARFELLSTDGVESIDLVRGPQSALYGAEAIGGVVAVRTRGRSTGVSASAEAGGKDFRRGSGAGTYHGERASFGLYGGYQESDGIDSFAGGGADGERDGYDNLTFGGSARVDDGDGLSATAAARFTEATSAFDGLDPATFARADTLDSTRNRIGAGRLSVGYGGSDAPLNVQVGATLLASRNSNRLDDNPLNRTEGRRVTADALASVGADTGAVSHRIIVAGDYEREHFVASDQSFGGATNQRRKRDRGSVVGELRSNLGDRLTADIAVRHDSFEGFRDATTVRAAVVARVAGLVSVLLSYGEGIARPTFFDLFGFFPGSFVGNPTVRPERSRGGEIGVRYNGSQVNVGVVAYRQRLKDEIVEVFTNTASTANATGTSRRQGLEFDATWRPSASFGLSAGYAYLDAEDRQVAGGALVKEVRRPKHSGSVSADGRFGRVSAGVSIAYVGSRIDNDFGSFPAPRVRLGDYVLGTARVAYRVAPTVELFARVSNLVDERYQDVVGYATQGRTLYGGVRLRYGD